MAGVLGLAIVHLGLDKVIAQAPTAEIHWSGPVDGIFVADEPIVWRVEVASAGAAWHEPLLRYVVTPFGGETPVAVGSVALSVGADGVGVAELVLQPTDLPAAEQAVWYQLRITLATASGEVELFDPSVDGGEPVRAFGVVPRYEGGLLAPTAFSPPVDSARRVMAFYYTWYGHPERTGTWHHWTEGGHNPDRFTPQGLRDIGSTHYPVLGTYDSFDVDVIRRHLAWAEAARIDVLIATWWGQGDFTDRVLEPLLDAAAETRVRIAFYYEVVPNHDPARAVDDFLYLLTRYGDHPGTFKYEGEPVIFIYSRAIHQLTHAQWERVLQTVKASHGARFIADTGDGDWAEIFDGLHMYNPVPQVVAGVDMSRVYEALVRAASDHGKISAVTVLPGYDDSYIGRIHPIVAPREDGQLYDRLWATAIQSRPDWVLVTSFNEWHEGSDIEPSLEHGYAYLEATAYRAEQFRTASERTFWLGRLSFPAVVPPGGFAEFSFEVETEHEGEDLVVDWDLPAGWEVVLLQPKGAPAGVRTLEGALTVPKTAATGTYAVRADVHLGGYSQSFEVQLGVVEAERAPYAGGSGAWVELGEVNRAFGLAQREAADGKTEAVNVAGVEGRRTVPGVSDFKYMYFDVIDSFLYDIEGETIEIVVEYLDEGTGTFQIQYDSHNPSAPLDGAYANGPSWRLTNTGTWKQVTFTFHNARLANRQNEGSDFRIAVGTGSMIVSRVWIRWIK